MVVISEFFIHLSKATFHFLLQTFQARRGDPGQVPGNHRRRVLGGRRRERLHQGGPILSIVLASLPCIFQLTQQKLRN